MGYMGIFSIIYPKPYSIYLMGTINVNIFRNLSGPAKGPKHLPTFHPRLPCWPALAISSQSTCAFQAGFRVQGSELRVQGSGFRV